MPTESPTVPPHGHLAVVAPDFDATLAACASPASRSAPRRTLGRPARQGVAPAATVVELMAAPPAPAE